MTTLSITADLAKKRLKVEGRVAAGEKVAVTVKGFGDKSVSNTRLRVMFAEKVVAIFPLPNAENGWTKDGEDLTGVLNLNTVQAERITQCGSIGCFWVLDDVSDEVRQLYGTAEHELLKWVKCPDTDVPVDLDSFQTLIEEMQQAIATFKSEIRGEWTNYQQTLSAAWTQYRDSLAELYSQFTNNVSSLVNGKASAQDLNAHTGNKSNPHEVTKAQVGLGNVDNTRDVDKPVSSQQQTAINSAKEQVANLVQSEARRATGKEQELRNGIDAEGRRASSAESGLDLAIRTEKARAEGAENELRESIKDVGIEFDQEPTEGSQKAARSGGIWSAIWGALTALPTGFSSIYDWCVSQFSNRYTKAETDEKLAGKRDKTDRKVYDFSDQCVIAPECLPISGGSHGEDWSYYSLNDMEGNLWLYASGNISGIAFSKETGFVSVVNDEEILFAGHPAVVGQWPRILPHETSDSLAKESQLAGKANSPIDFDQSHAGNLASLTAEGDLADSGINKFSIITDEIFVPLTTRVSNVESGLDVARDDIDIIGGRVSGLEGDKADKSDIVDPALAEAIGKIADAKLTRDFVNTMVSTNSAHYLTARAGTAGSYTYPPFASAAALRTALAAHTAQNPQFFYAGEAFTPTKNDWAIVSEDEDHPLGTITPASRYGFVGTFGSGGTFQYQVSYKLPLTTAQIAALDSGATATRLSGLKSDGTAEDDFATDLLGKQVAKDAIAYKVATTAGENRSVLVVEIAETATAAVNVVVPAPVANKVIDFEVWVKVAARSTDIPQINYGYMVDETFTPVTLIKKGGENPAYEKDASATVTNIVHFTSSDASGYTVVAAAFK